MANRLKEIFSNDTPEYKATFKFKDPESYQSFCKVLSTVDEEGCFVSVEGIDTISTSMQLHGVAFPIDQHDNVTEFRVGPSKEPFDLSVIWDDNEKVYKFYKYYINSGCILETDKNAVVYIKLLFSNDFRRVNINYEIQYQNAKSIEEINFEINACLSLITKFVDPTNQKGTTEEAETIRKVFEYLKRLAEFISRLLDVEKTLGLAFLPEKLNSLSKEDYQDIEDLYLLLCKKLPLRLNEKLNTTEGSNIEAPDIKTEHMIGEEISLVFVQEIKCELLGQEFSIHTANVVINAIIKDIKKDDGKTTVYYGDTDSKPMYIVYSAYSSKEEAKEEAGRNIGNESKYINALTSGQYIKEIYKDIENQ